MVAPWIAALGIRDPKSGHAAAVAARERILEPARSVLGSSSDITIVTLVFQGFVARAQGLHEAATSATDAENPHAAFTLLRAYAENAAAILYARDKPDQVGRFFDSKGHEIPIGRITSHAAKSNRFGPFKSIYGELSQYSHPQSLGIIASMSVEGSALRWASAPHFKRAEDQLLAYAWVVELAEATHHLLYEFGQRHRLGYFGEQSATQGEEG